MSALTDNHPLKNERYRDPISTETLRGIFADCSDLVVRELQIGGAAKPVSAFFIDGLVNSEAVAVEIIRPLTEPERFSYYKNFRTIMDALLAGAVNSASVREVDTLDAAAEAIANGFFVLVFDSEKSAVCFEARTANARSVSAPGVEKSVKGAKDSFVEVLRVNTSLVRRHLRSPDLKIESINIGLRSGTGVALFYISGLTNMELVAELRNRLKKIDIDGLITPGNLEEYIVDRPSSPVPQALHTERPDRFCLNLLEGRVGVIADGIPLGFIMPVNLHQFFRVPEDSSHHFAVSSLIAVIRYTAIIFSAFLPAIVVAITMYHQEMIPTKLLFSIIETRQKVPFSMAMEILGLLLSFLILQEAQLRLPSPVGETVSIIGALIVGQAAVEANIVSPVSVIVFAMSAISGYTVTDYDLGQATQLCRIFMVFAAIFGGLYGVAVSAMLVFYHLCSVSSLGVPYMLSYSDGQSAGIWRAVPFAPLRRRKLRPESPSAYDRRNQA